MRDARRGATPSTRWRATSSICCSTCTRTPRYWVNTSSPKGYIVEKLLLAADRDAQRQPVTGDAVRYVDWLFPGILGMNMMFSCLFGVGYVVLRYRKTGFLKRLHATPLSAFEFLSAQVLSRLGADAARHDAFCMSASRRSSTSIRRAASLLLLG